MAITIGLDFGTHQTKICIEDTADKQNPRYTFWKFEDLDGSKQLVCPSVVQLNEDNTLSYGYVSDSNCKMGFHIDVAKPQEPKLEEPKLEIPPKPLLVLPEKPHKLSNVESQEYDSLKRRVLITNNRLEADYNAICLLLQKQHEKQKTIYTSAWETYHKQLRRWEIHQATPIKMRYYYFNISSI